MRILLVFLLLGVKTELFPQKINNLELKQIGSDIDLTFNIQPKFNNRAKDERYRAEVYVKELISGYDEVSTESFFRNKINLPYSSTNNLRFGMNKISIDVYDYLSEYLGKETLFEFEVNITPTFIPAYIGDVQKLKIGKGKYLNANIFNYWENANVSYSLSQDGSVVHTGEIDETIMSSIPKSLKKGDYMLNLIVEAYGNRDVFSRGVQLTKGSFLPYLLLPIAGAGYLVISSGSGKKKKSNPPLPSPPLPPGG